MQLRSNATSRLLAACGAVVLGLVSGCDYGLKGEAVVRQRIEETNAVVEAIERGAPREEILALADRLTETEHRFQAMDLTEAEQQALIEKYGEEMEAVHSRAHTALRDYMSRQQRESMKQGFGPPSLPGMPLPTP